ncbi:MAG TPA: hypothetical protein VFV34_11340 [Blastocatellia bacterium]|nr:hypothetical protein [Blastocatellia bacterium]
MAHVCLNMPLQDADGRWIIHYLGKEFEQSITKRQHHELYSKAREFVVGQLNKHRAALNTKLALRYDRLLRYFDLHGTPRTE